MYHNMEHADIIRKMTEEFDEVLILHFFTALMQCRRGLVMRILSIRPSVRHTRELWQNGRKICPDL